MKILITGDWHYTDKIPDCRIDDYRAAEENKIRQIFDIAKKEYVEIILQAGDLTDTPFLSYSTYIYLSYLLSETPVPIFTVYGQHDLRYRNKGNTPLDALFSNGFLTILKPEPYITNSTIKIYGCSFGENHPEINNLSTFNILVLHQLIVSTQNQDWQKEMVLHSSLLENSEFDLIVSGDNHKSFVIHTEDNSLPKRWLVNCGSLMRSTIEQVNHEPFVVIFDTDDRSIKKVFIKITPWGDTFDLERKVKIEENSEHLEAFVEGLKEHKDMGLDFVANLHATMQENKTEKPIVDIVNSWITT